MDCRGRSKGFRENIFKNFYSSFNSKYLFQIFIFISFDLDFGLDYVIPPIRMIELKLHCANFSIHSSDNKKMPLSSALQARLIERGILNASNINAALDASAENDDDNEEVFAENYDERDEHQPSSTSPKKVSMKICTFEFFIWKHFRAISLQQIFKLNLKNVLNVQINGILIILAWNTVGKGRL